jgi:hypothetical protein
VLIEKSTPQIDTEIRSLPSSLMVPFVRMLSAKLEDHQQIDFLQAIICTFFRIHQTRITSLTRETERSENEENIAVPLTASDLTKELEELHTKLTSSNAKLEKLYTETLPVLKWIKSALI